MKRLNSRNSRLAGLLALALGAVALLALSGVATAKDRHGDDNGHGHHGRHHHHLRELHEAGTISSFDPATGKLTLALTGGGSVTGLVTTETKIRCEGSDDRLTQRRDHGGDDNGGRGTEPGDDNGGQAEPGDDHGGQGARPGNDDGGHATEPGDDNGGANEPGDDHGGQGTEPGDDNGGNVPMPAPGTPAPGAPANCGVSSLVTGAFVGEAELRLGTGGNVFAEIELGHDS